MVTLNHFYSHTCPCSFSHMAPKMQRGMSVTKRWQQKVLILDFLQHLQVSHSGSTES